MDKGGAKAERGYPGPTRGKVEKSRNKLKKFNLFRISREKNEISFDIVVETGNIVAKNGNNVEATYSTLSKESFNL